jgi:hypothetical protein
MKSKLFKILGVVAVVAMLASAIVAPVAATVASVTATVATTGTPPANQISAVGNYSIYATLATQLMGAANGSISLPDVGDKIVFTEVNAYDKVTVTGTVAGLTPVLTGTAAYNATTGVITFATGAGTATFTSLVRLTTGAYVINAGAPTISYAADATVAATNAAGAFTLPDMATTGGTASTITYTAAAAGNTVVLTVTAGSASVSYTTGGTFVGTTWTAAAALDVLTVTATTNNTTGTYVATGATAGVGAPGTILSSSTSAASGDTITVTFPAGFTVPNTGVAGTLAATAGWVTFPGALVATNVAAGLPPVPGTAAAVVSSSSATSVVTFTLPAGDYIGSGAQILINITAGVVNPGTAGSYAVTVATSQETTAVTSSTFAIVNPIIPVIAGVATVYNSAGIQMTQSNDLAFALNYVQTNAITGAVIKLTAGTYNTALVGTSVACTIQGTDASAANVILKSSGAWAMTGKTVVIDSVTIDGTNGQLTVSTPAGGAGTVSNSNIIGNMLIMNNTTTGTSTLNKDTFTVKTGKTGANLSNAAVNGAVVTACTFNVTGTGIGLVTADDVTLSGSTFTGAAVTDNSTTATGVGISLTAGATPGSVTSITGSTFTGLSPALVVADGTKATFSGNTVTACGVTSTYDAISVTGTTGLLYIMNNKITNSLQYIVNIALGGNDNNVFIMENNFSGNVKNVNNSDTTITKVNATHNYWGGTANNPASTSSVDYSNPLGSLPTSTNFTTGAPASFDATATAGVNVTAITGATVVGAAALTGNPVTPTISSANTVVKYFDVFGIGTATATIQFFGATPASITANSQIFFYNSTFGTWQTCANQTINTYGNYVQVVITGVAANDAPTAAQFNGLPFALVTVPQILGGVTPGATPLYPVNGSVNVPITNMTFTWPAVAGAGVTYQFALAQASANTSANEFAILDYSDNTLTNAEPSQETLQYNTVYWWEVRAVTLNSSGAVSATGPWSINMFTTMPAPVTTTGTAATGTTIVTSVVITNPVTTVVSTNTSVVITQTTGNSTPAIPSYLLWAVIAVGAVLIIAVIVLIVRTRRIP